MGATSASRSRCVERVSRIVRERVWSDDLTRFDTQLVDDILDYEASEAALGKPGGADLQLGLATGPALYAWEEHPEMGPLIARKFGQEGDVELVRSFVLVLLFHMLRQIAL